MIHAPNFLLFLIFNRNEFYNKETLGNTAFTLNTMYITYPPIQKAVELTNIFSRLWTYDAAYVMNIDIIAVPACL